jgi:hypothetical protein
MIYGDSLGPTFESLKAKGLSNAEIAISACLTGGQDLGVESNTSYQQATVGKLKERRQELQERRRKIREGGVEVDKEPAKHKDQKEIKKERLRLRRFKSYVRLLMKVDTDVEKVIDQLKKGDFNESKFLGDIDRRSKWVRRGRNKELRPLRIR